MRFSKFYITLKSNKSVVYRERDTKDSFILDEKSRNDPENVPARGIIIIYHFMNCNLVQCYGKSFECHGGHKEKLFSDLEKYDDPRIIGGADAFDQYEYLGRLLSKP